ncbi:MAG: glycosyltransferase family 4 protein [Gloeomargaritaceae cyanobacterium C42_A2020_066]|nr:glycosyltransferase family 4 protein [Gloeomargaritaceae cyanobacterium C42_A2020_066]
MGTLLFHPSTAPFVQQVGRAFYERGSLAGFATTLVDRPAAPWRKLLARIRPLAGQLQRRSVTEFPLDLVVNSPWGELARLAAGRVDKSGILTDRVWEWSETGFDRWVAENLLSSEVSAVYGYEHAALATFEAAKARGLRCIYDVQAPEHEFVQSLLQAEQAHYPEVITPYHVYIQQHQARRTARRRQEWQLADVVVANSEFTKSTYAQAGLDTSRVVVVPYGAPPVHPEGVEGGGLDPAPLRVLWAGSFSLRKGAHYLLDAWRDWAPGERASLRVFGALSLPEKLLAGRPANIALSGTIPRATLYQEYQQADILVFPTLCDGFGMVVTEAFSRGLPVITTPQAGAADLVKPYVNGLIVPAGDSTALAEALEWCATHRQALRTMRQAALETAASWQWSDYRRALTDSLASTGSLP